MTRVLVTGSAGFIGSHLAAHLTEKKYEVVLCDSFSSYYSIEYKRERVRNLLGNLNKLYEIDLADEAETRNFISEYRPEIIVHLAAQAGVRLPVSLYSRYVRENVLVFTNILSSCVEFGIHNLIYASSSSVYDDSRNEAFIEGSTKLDPKSFYGVTKKWNEEAAFLFSDKFGLKTRGLRFFTVYGPWGRPDMAYFRLMAAALGENQFTLFGDGAVERDFTYIDDVIVRTEILIRNLIQQPSGFRDVVNIGGQNPLSMRTLIKTIENVSGQDFPIHYGPANPTDLIKTEADKKYGASIFGETPYTSLEVGISNFFKWASEEQIRSQLKNWISSTI